MQTLPPDVAAYLVQAAVDLAKEQGCAPSNEADLAEWQSRNFRAIGERALELMDALKIRLLDNPELAAEARRHLSRSVWATIRSRYQPSTKGPTG